jgi:hypothetical protein
MWIINNIPTLVVFSAAAMFVKDKRERRRWQTAIVVWYCVGGVLYA